MVITLLDRDFIAVRVIDVYESFIWTDRYSEAGDFELYTGMDKELFDDIIPGYYLSNSESDRLMIVEGIEIVSNVETGNHLRVTGRSLESILDRRIVWNQTTFDNSPLQTCVYQLINDAILNPAIQDRHINNFIFETNDDPRINEILLEAQFTGDTLYEAITDICQTNSLGYKVLKNEDNEFVFQLYFGTDRSSAQTENLEVTFSPSYDNILESDYKESTDTYKNVTLVLGEGEGAARKNVTVGEGSGLDRRELYTDARDISSNSSGGTIPAAKYLNLLSERGKENLKENRKTRLFEGKVDTTQMFKFGVDFFIGDIVNFFDEYGNSARVRIEEIIFNEDENGYTAYPTFTVLDEEDIR